MNILIQGGGLCGLATAALLEQEGHKVTIVEKYKNWDDPVGFAINLWDIGLDILDLIGVKEAILTHAYSVPYIQSVDTNGTILLKEDWTNMLPQHGGPHTIERHFLHAGLRKRCENMNIHLGATIEDITEHTDGIEARLSNGITEHADIVIGADGIHSAIRKYCFDVNEPTYYGWKHWLFFVPDTVEVPEGINQIWAQNCFFFTFPGRYRSVAWCTMVAPPDVEDPVEGRIERIIKRFDFIDYLVPDILGHLTDPDEMFYGNVATVNMTSWKQGRVILAGDAEHAPTPLMGMGASMAMEDGLILAEELRGTTSGTLDAALGRYEVRRRKRIQRMQRLSKLMWHMIVMPHPSLAKIRNATAPLLGKPVVKQAFGSVLSYRP